MRAFTGESSIDVVRIKEPVEEGLLETAAILVLAVPVATNTFEAPPFSLAANFAGWLPDRRTRRRFVRWSRFGAQLAVEPLRVRVQHAPLLLESSYSSRDVMLDSPAT